VNASVDQKRLLIVSSEFPPGPGGIGCHAHQLAADLLQFGWEVSVLTPQDYATDSEIAEFAHQGSFRVVRAPSGRGPLKEALWRVLKGLRLVKSFRPVLLLGTGLSGVWICAAISRLTGIPAVAVAHGSEILQQTTLKSAINRMAFERMQSVAAVSQFSLSLLKEAGIRPCRTRVILNGGDAAVFRQQTYQEVQAFRSQLGLSDKQILLTLGHVSERKGQEVVIRSLPEILAQCPRAHYVMIGLPTLQPQLEKLAGELGVLGNIHFLGKQTTNNVVAWLNACDLFVMTSRRTASGDCEGFGIAVIEAALCGKPAVVSGQSGLVEAINPEVTGLAVPENDPSATAEAVVSLLSDPKKMNRMGEAALRRARDGFTRGRCAAQYDQWLREQLLLPAPAGA
jgi:phosphatidylinositol alpha-1,6-mannosyltransferase